jgi:hypothetical protein
MKYIIVTIALFLATNVKAQMITKDSLLTVMGSEVCKGIEGKDLSKMDKSNMQMEMGMMMMPTFAKYMKEIKEYYGNITDQNIAQKLGMDIGLKLMDGSCPKFMEFAMSMAGSEDMAGDKKSAQAKVRMAENDANTELKGTFITINQGDITTISIKDAKGKIQKLYWLEYFENADEIKDASKKYINKKVIATYTDKDVYDAAKKTYKTIKVLTGVELQ